LHATLKKPGGVQELLNQPSRWELFLKTADAELTQAQRLMAGAEGSLDADVSQRLVRQRQHLTRDEADYRLAVRLEKIRLDTAVVGEVKALDHSAAEREYSREFMAAGLAGESGLNDEAAERINQSAIREQLLASLDHWAWLAEKLKRPELSGRLL